MTAEKGDSLDDQSLQLVEKAQAALQKGELPEAARLAEDALREKDDNLEALYILAVCLRYGRQSRKALPVLQRILELEPSHARAWQEAGHNYLALNESGYAQWALEQAVQHNNALPAAWKALQGIYNLQGNTAQASRAGGHLQRLESLPRELLSVSSFIQDGKLLKAEQLCRAYLKDNPRDIEAMRLLAELGVKLNVLDDAEFLLESALEFSPDFRQARYDYANVLHKRQKYSQAYAQAAELRREMPGNPAFETLYANQCLALGRFDEALAIYDKLLHDHPDNAGVHMSRGHALKTMGQQDEAVEAYRAAAKLHPGFGDAYWSLANLKTYEFPDSELEQMAALEASSRIGLNDRFHLCFALGKAWEDRQQFEQSFTYYERGNHLKKSELGYSPDRLEAELEAQKNLCTGDFFSAREGWGCPSPDPIFILGLPRAGSTLLEQVLASHSQVDGTMELPNILALVHRLNGRRRMSEKPRYPDILEDLSAEQLREYGEAYIEDTRIHRSNAPFFIDKMPNNFRHLALIKLILPNAKIIDARRHPMACCFSGFKQLFAEGQEFSYGLDEIGRYYRAYVDLMDHWDEVLPGKVLRVQYEEVVADFGPQVRRILDFCNLPFERECIEFYRNERAVRTASSEQVRQPLYQSSVEHWRNFEPWLDPLKEALGSVLDRYPLS